MDEQELLDMLRNFHWFWPRFRTS